MGTLVKERLDGKWGKKRACCFLCGADADWLLTGPNHISVMSCCGKKLAPYF